MSDLKITLEGDKVTIVCDRRFGTVLIEGARRDLNAMSQAFGLAPELRNQYSRFAAQLTDASKAIPRINLFVIPAFPAEKVAPPVQVDIEEPPVSSRRFFFHEEFKELFIVDDPDAIEHMDAIFEEIDEATYNQIKREQDLEDLLG